MSENRPIDLITPVKVQTTDSVVLDSLVRYVAEAKLTIGDRLPSERELGERLKVSRNTVREAVKRWEALGVVERRKGSGTFLISAIKPGDNFFSMCVQNNVEHMLHSLELRRILETQACALAAQRATAKDIDTIRGCIEAIERSHENAEIGGNEDWEFHCAIYRATQNPMFEQMVSGLYDAFNAFLDAPEEQQVAVSSVTLHRDLFNAIEARDSDKARSLCNNIIDVMESEMKKLSD